jgi:hypothetical protein
MHSSIHILGATRVGLTVQTHRNEWENVETEETCMLIGTASEKPETETYSRNSKEPRTIKEAMKMSDRDQWKQAVEDELNKLIEMGTWKLVPLPKGRKAVGCRVVLKRKFNLDGTVSRWKAREQYCERTCSTRTH